MSAALGTWDQVFADAAPEVRARGQAALAPILAVDPRAVETTRRGDGAVTFGLGPAKMKQGHADLAPHKAGINLGFYHGATLPDPAGRLEGTGKSLRHMKIARIG